MKGQPAYCRHMNYCNLWEGREGGRREGGRKNGGREREGGERREGGKIEVE